MTEYEKLRKAIDRKLSTDPEFRTIVKRINGGRATFIDTSRYSQITAQAVGNGLSAEVLSLDDRESVCTQLLQDSYDDINEVCSRVQGVIDEDTGINIRPQKAEFPAERVRQIAHSLIDPTVADEVIQRRADKSVANVAMSFHDDYIKANASFRNDAGLTCYIVREGSNCCDWCSGVTGKYKFGTQPVDIFRRHDNCDCTIIYDGQVLRGKQNADGSRSKTWEEIPDADGSYKPTVLTAEQAKELEQRNLQQFKGLTSGGDSGRINYARAIDSMFYADDYEYKTYTKEEIIENLKTSAVGLETIQYLEDNPQVKVKLSEDAEKSDRGEHNKNLLTVWLNNCPNVRVAGQTVVHEVTHHKFDIGGSQQAETICFAFEKMHKENRKYLTQDEWDVLVDLTKEVYWDLPAVGGVDNLERFDFIVKKR